MEETKKPRKNYSIEFKQEAVARSKTIGSSKTCKELGISSSTLHKWKNEQNIKPAKLGKPSYEDLEKEVKRLKKENGYIKDINHILKKSTAIFSSNHIGGLK